ncbi:MAG: N-acetylmuramoyl-L-alanine amidase family protein [Candidatus Acidiferrales bacterium]
MRRILFPAFFLGIVSAALVFAQQATPPAAPPAAQGATTPQIPVPVRHVLSVVVLDAGHGGADSGARGQSGIVEKDWVMAAARLVRAELQGDGFRVVMTRDGDEDPSFDDRAGKANAQRDAIFVSLHVSSTGEPGTARVYSYQFSAPLAASSAPPGWVPWNEAQRPFTNLSGRLADLMQVQLAQRFRGSPEISTAFPVRVLRSVAAPAVAVEISSVSVADPGQLDPLMQPLAQAIGRALIAFKPIYEAAAN